jgi:hypothetical protein
MSREFRVLISMKKTGFDNIVIGPAEVPGIRRGAYVRVKLAVGDVAEYYSAPANVDSCHARNINEGLTRADENCHLIVDNQGCICLPKEALLTRYGFKHWMHEKWPLPILEAIFVKYTAIVNCEGNRDKNDDEDSDDKNGNEDTITNKQVAIWQSIINKK